MKLLLTTQAVDIDDPVLSVYHDWIVEIASQFETVEVICLKEGRHALPDNVKVHSLGKESCAQNKVMYATRFLALSWRLRHSYDAVFVHMNQEYILIAGWFWKVLQKPVYLWRNHYAGSILTDIAATFCNKIFYTSKHSYTAKYAKAKILPVGVNAKRFFLDEHIARKPHSILFLARMTPSKRPELLIEALEGLLRQGIPFTANFYGSPLPHDRTYYEALKTKVQSLGLADIVAFCPGVPNEQTPNLYRTHDIFVNTSPSGMLDKTLFEAAASGCLVLAASEDIAELLGEEASFSDAQDLSRRLMALLRMSPYARGTMKTKLSELVARNTLTALAATLSREINPSLPQ